MIVLIIVCSILGRILQMGKVTTGLNNGHNRASRMQVPLHVSDKWLLCERVDTYACHIDPLLATPRLLMVFW
jgi:hypothetical protein